MIKRPTIKWIAEAIHGCIRKGDPETEYLGISTDSRSLRPGEIFWALKGDKFDGRDFIKEAIEKGALGVVLQSGRLLPPNKEGLVVVEVEDTLWALGEFAAQYRHLFDIPIVAVTGSNGKTTTKEMIASILSTRKRVLKNQGNLNNLIGLPLSLLKVAPEHDVGVFELGMNRRGEIARLTEISSPTVGVITNVGPVHLEYLIRIEEVAEAKGELFQKMPSEAVAIINKDDPWVDKLSSRFLGKKVTVGINHPAEITTKNITLMGTEGITFDLVIREKTLPVFIPMIGEHNVRNALASAAVIVALGEDPEIIPEGLKNFTNLSLRQETVKLKGEITLINDAYNANPVSMKRALETFSRLKGASRGIALLGDMLELGPESNALHRELGEEVAKFGIQYLLLMGDYASQVREGAIAGGLPSDSIWIGREHQELSDILSGLLKEGDWVLVKGSRKMKMEKIAERLMVVDDSAGVK